MRHMTRVMKTLGWTMLVALLLGIAVVVAVAASIGPFEPGWIEINGEPLVLADLHAGHWLVSAGAAVLGVVVALVVALGVVLLVVPIAVLVPLFFAALVLLGALLLVAGIAALAFSPLLAVLAIVWLIWRLRRRDDARAHKAGATITG